jgi:tetratricopeptide (TPR) repeat protein
VIDLRKAHELDVVELTEDLPEYDVRQGARGTVVEVFDEPEEAYMIEFLEDAGKSSKIADWVKPDQIKNVETIAKEHYTRGMSQLEEGDYVEASRELHRAIELIPSYVRGLHESLRHSLAPIEDWPRLVAAMQFVIIIDPSYELAKHNLAIAFLNWGANEANKNNYDDALRLFRSAVRVEAPTEIRKLILENISASHAALGVRAYEKGDLLISTKHFEAAFSFNESHRTRHDLALAYFHIGDACLKNSDNETAIMYYQWAQDTGLITSEVLNNHGCALAAKGDLDGAIVLFESGLALEPEDRIMRDNLKRATQGKSATELVAQSTPQGFNPIQSMSVVRTWASAGS